MLWDGAGPLAVDGLANVCCCDEYGERLPEDGAVIWLDSFDVVERLESLLSEDNEDCDLWPEGECGLGGGRSGGRLLSMWNSEL